MITPYLTAIARAIIEDLSSIDATRLSNARRRDAVPLAQRLQNEHDADVAEAMRQGYVNYQRRVTNGSR